jgi:hypothetical protein
MSEKPRPCPNPWCAKEGIAIEVYGGAFRVVCCCGLEGPLTLTSEEATSAWNSRPVEDALVEALKQLRLENHSECNDSWYSCPKSEIGCSDDDQGEECNCGVDARNLIIDAALKLAGVD